MARSIKERLEAARAREERAKRQVEKAREEMEKLIQPSKRKIVSAVEDVADQFVRENLEQLDEIELDRGRIQERVAVMLREELAMSVGQATENGTSAAELNAQNRTDVQGTEGPIEPGIGAHGEAGSDQV
mgnify:CR=1 FL=1